MIIGLTGRIASGKGSAVKFFSEKNFKNVTISDLIKQELIKRGIPVTRENLQDIGDEVRREEGAGAWVKRINFSEKDLIVDGLRNPGEVEELKKHRNFSLISIDCPQEVRYKRIVSRGMERDKMSFEDFVKKDNREIMEKESTKMQLEECMNLADFNIENIGTMQEFYEKLEEIYGKILNK